MRKLPLALFAASALTFNGNVPQAVAGPTMPQVAADPTTPNSAADPAPQACRGQFISSVVQAPPDGFGPGRRTVAEMFFNDQPHAVHDAEQFLKKIICPPG